MAFVLANGHRNHHGENGLHMNGQDSLVQPLLTDYYQITMCYAYWRAGTHDQTAIFDLFFRKNPFQGEFTVFAGLEDCLRFVENFRFTRSDVDFIRKVMPKDVDPAFFKYLESLTCEKLIIRAIPEGTVVFPKVPLITVEGPLAVCQLMETTFLNLVNYASLVATNAARFRQVAGERKQMLEFGLRRAQGPNGALTASKYCYIGGFNGTSNVLAGKLYGIPVKGTQAHSFVCSFSSEKDLQVRMMKSKDGSKVVDLYQLAVEKRIWIFQEISTWGVALNEVNDGELAAFVAYAIAFPETNLSLIDTYDVLRSGVVNYLAISLALFEIGYTSVGCRIDSGDLAYLSKEVRAKFKAVAALKPELAWMEGMTIVASNDINEETIMSLNEQQHEIDAYGVGTHLVTCQKQPALGCVYKLVHLDGQSKIKLSQEVSKITIPGKKRPFRLYGKGGYCILDLILGDGEIDKKNLPVEGQQLICRHPFEESKRAHVTPSKVEALHKVYWSMGMIQQQLPSLDIIRARVNASLHSLRKDHCRYLNPTPYKVSVSEELYTFLHSMWLENAPIGKLE